MEASGSRRLRTRLETVVAKLGDAEILAASIPKCQSVTGNRRDGFAFVISYHIGPMNTMVRGRITLTEVQPNARYRVTIEGKIGIMGSIRASAALSLKQMPKATVITYTAQSQLTGWKAMLGGGKTDLLFNRGVSAFFDRFIMAVDGGNRAPEQLQA